MADDTSPLGPHTQAFEAELARKMEEYKNSYGDSIRSEFDLTGGLKPAQIDANEKAKDDILQMRETAKKRLMFLMQNADSESVQANVSMFVYKTILDWEEKAQDGDDFTKIMNKIIKKAETAK